MCVFVIVVIILILFGQKKIKYFNICYAFLFSSIQSSYTDANQKICFKFKFPISVEQNPIAIAAATATTKNNERLWQNNKY